MTAPRNIRVGSVLYHRDFPGAPVVVEHRCNLPAIDENGSLVQGKKRLHPDRAVFLVRLPGGNQYYASAEWLSREPWT